MLRTTFLLDGLHWVLSGARTPAFRLRKDREGACRRGRDAADCRWSWGYVGVEAQAEGREDRNLGIMSIDNWREGGNAVLGGRLGFLTSGSCTWYFRAPKQETERGSSAPCTIHQQGAWVRQQGINPIPTSTVVVWVWMWARVFGGLWKGGSGGSGT